jgi:hypothetical protein
VIIGANNLVAYDLDGVVTMGALRLPEHPIIITGRSFERHADTAEILQGVGVVSPVLYACPVKVSEESVYAACVWKCHIINMAGITVFYDDDMRVADYLQKRCPNCTIVVHREWD